MKIEIKKRPNGSKRVLMHCDDDSRTRQEFKNECDLNLIIKRFSKTPEGRSALENARGYLSARFGDVSDVPDYQVALNQVKRANEVFEALPAVLRKRFDHDPSKFLEFCDNPNNLDEMRSLGLAKPALQDAAKTQVVTKPTEVGK